MDKNKEKKWFNINAFVSKIAQVVVTVGGMATITSCTTFFHETKVPNELLNNHPFSSKE